MGEYLIKLKDVLHILDAVMSDDSIKHKGKAIRKRLKELPTEDVEKVVRCKDCVFSRELVEYEKKLYLDNCVGCCFHSKSYYSLIMEDEDFCSCGKRKEGAEE